MMKKKLLIVFLSLVLLSSMTIGVFADAEDDIVDTAIAAGDFDILVAAVEAAGLVNALKGDGPFTVFAPTDEAFAALLQDLNIEAADLLGSENLADILLYHVVEGKVMSSDLEDGMEATTLNGQSVTISINSDVKVTEANVVTPDVEASNGVIHIIDAVLVPDLGDGSEGTEEDDTVSEDSKDIVETAISAGIFETLVAAVQEQT
ncbi:fasciclin domain-containing protein [Evansella tamaricis]|uniref:fasciclin domain-containing protein n=1 Tax=Evansella tamaricis TaxID=2069301 RepID=UPI001FEACBA7|nr:fasciclin domain-containing protein [Evansella tamaricis]